MFHRLSVNVILKSVIATLAAVSIVLLALNAWDSRSRLVAANRMAAVAEASAYIFTALHNLRVDRTSSYRDLLADKQSTSLDAMLRKMRDAEMAALKSAVAALEAVDFPERQATIADLTARMRRLDALHEETSAAFGQPKAARRPGLAQEFLQEAGALLDALDQLSSRLTRVVKLDDSFNDQLMELKQLAWIGRNAAGDGAVMISNTLGGQPLPPDALVQYTAHISKLETAWSALQDVAAGLPLPARFTQALDKANREYFAKDYVALRLKVLKALIAGEPTGVVLDQWTPASIAKLATLLGVAEAALDVAKDHAAAQRAAALRSLATQLALLAAAILFAAGMMWMISRRVSGPLLVIQQAMLKLAGGDLSAHVSFTQRKDEIGALAGAMRVFRDGMSEAERLRVEQKATEARAATERKAEMQRLAGEFQAAVGNIVDAVSSASAELETAAGTLTRTADTTQRLAGVVATASDDASGNVQSVASAAEEMSSSVNEIARQVNQSSKIAGEAVKQAQKTDARITELSSAASRIGDVVKLITAIAEQTNLLALNATIEAARAGEAGKGFAVVAQEVKALAAQTAKATDEIGTQISSMQAATQESVTAIKEIGGTIGRIAEIAATIAAAVEEQGAATQEISRNVQHAAQGTAQVATSITDVNRGASETGTASSRVLGSAQSLARESGRLKVEVEKFLEMVRAA